MGPFLGLAALWGTLRRLASGVFAALFSASEIASAKSPATPSAGLSTCPKCRRELAEGESEYVCCAGELLSWTCETCGKVSEGFAFPFGLCPACGGNLARRQEEPLGAAPIEAVRQAMQIELGGMAFYERGARETLDPDVKELFTRLIDMEKEHGEILSRRYHIQPQEGRAPGVTPSQIAVYAGAEPPRTNGASLLRLAVHLENRARRFFLNTGRTFPEGSPEWRLYRELEAEEREHAELLETALRAYEDERAVLI
jgi:rubrerythrin